MKWTLFLLLSAFSLYAADAANTAPPPAAPATEPAAIMANAAKSIYTIDPKNRSADLIQAYDLLKKEKPTLKISLRTANGSILANVTDLAAASKGTLLFAKIQSNIGPKVVILPVEEVLEIYYSS